MKAKKKKRLSNFQYECKTCGEVFKTADEDEEFCSQDCTEGRIKDFLKMPDMPEQIEKLPKEIIVRIERACEICGKKFSVKVGHNRRCCSIRCTNARNARISLENSERRKRLIYEMRFDELDGGFLRLRFEVFKRDDFRCQYCGRNPKTDKDCILHADHIHPRAKGGEDTIENLTTSCLECNLGKSDILLTTRHIKKTQNR